MTEEDIAVGVKIRLIVDLPDHQAGSIGLVTQRAHDPWRFWLCWPLPGQNSYSLAFQRDDLRHFEIVQEPMTEAECAALNYQLTEPANVSRRRRKVIVEQLSLPLSED